MLAAVLGAGARESSAEARTRASALRLESRAAPTEDARFFLERDRGQLPAGVAFRARSPVATAFLDGDGVAFAANGAAAGETAVRLSFGGLGRLAWQGREPLAARASCFVGRDPAGWRTEIPLFGAAVALDERTGVEVRFGADAGRPAYSFRVPAGAPGGVPSLHFSGASGIELDRRGNLAVAVAAGQWTHSAPRAFEETSRGSQEVPCRFVVASRSEVRIDVDRRDPAAALFVDPRVDFATTCGVPVWNESSGRVSVDGQGRLAYAYTASAPPPSPYYGQPIAADVVVLRMDASGRRLLWSATIGGNGSDGVGGIVARDSGAVLLAGDTRNGNSFPLVDPVFAVTPFAADAFVCQIAPGGGSLEFSSIYGGTGPLYEPSPDPGHGDDTVGGVCVASDGCPVVVGTTDSIDLRVVGEFGRASAGGFEGFVLRLSPDGRTVIHAGHLGGAGRDRAGGVAPGPGGSVVVVGTAGSDFPVLDPISGVSGSGGDAFVTRLSSVGEVTWSTRLGGGYDDAATAVVVAADGTAYVAGWTDSTDLPAVGPGPFGPRGGRDLFVAHVDPDARTLLQSVVFGGTYLEDAPALCLDPAGRLWLTARTTSADIPILDAVAGDPGASASRNFVPFVAVFSADCDLLSSGYLGGTGSGVGDSIAAGGAGLAWLGGRTSGTDFPSVDAPTGTGIEAGDAYLLAAGSGPARPQPVTGTTSAPGSATFSWDHDGQTAAGFIVERSDDAGPFQVIARPDADVRSVAEEDLLPGTFLAYRVRAVGPAGDESRWSEEVAVALAVPTSAPAAPTGLSVVAEEVDRVRLAWTDASDDESWFEVERTRPGDVVAIVASLPPGSTDWTDSAPAPDRIATYRVRSGNVAGASPWTDAVPIETAATLDVTIARGTIRWHGAAPKGSVVLHGSIARADGEPYDVQVDGLTVHLQGWDGPVLVEIPAADGGWKVRRGRSSWTTPRGASPRVHLTLTTSTGRFHIDVTRVAPPPLEAGLVLVSAGNATEGGTDAQEWRRRGRTLFVR